MGSRTNTVLFPTVLLHVSFLIHKDQENLYSPGGGALGVSCLCEHDCFHQTQSLHFYSIVKLSSN